MTYIDDNFGHWDMDGDNDKLEFYHQVQAESRWKRCLGCGGLFKLRPDYGLCNGCADSVERGGDVEYPEVPDPEVDKELQVRRAEDKVDREIRARADHEEFEHG